MLPELTIGLDLAQAFDYTGLVALQHRPGTAADPRPSYAARMIERWRYKPYTMLPALIQRAEERLRRALAEEHFQRHGHALHLWNDVSVTWAVDATGVGAPVIDALVEAGLQPVPILITGGFSVNRRDGGGFTVPKGDLVAAVQIALESRRLQIPKELPHADTLTSELQNFRYEISPAGHIRYGAGPAGQEDLLWRGDGSHDDLLLATACALWLAERQGGGGLDPVIVAAFADMPRCR